LFFLCRNISSVKRPRTASRSPSPADDKAIVQDESDDGTNARNSASKKSRAARNQRERSEKEERDRQRLEAANKRKSRADRRRAEGLAATILVKGSETHMDTDSDPSEELPLAAARLVNSKTSDPQPQKEPPPSSQPTPDTPPPHQASSVSSIKKGARAQPKKGKGRNQYTKDREDHEESPARSMSRDIQKNADDNGSAHNGKSNGSDTHKHGTKSKNPLPSKFSMGDLKRRVSVMLEFISRTQVELAMETDTPPESRNSGNSTPKDGAPGSLPKIQLNGESGTDPKTSVENGYATVDVLQGGEEGFKHMKPMEMMDSLTRDLLKWQNEFIQ
jgi:hypothetical protein